MIDVSGAVELARVVETHYSWQGTGFRVYCLELRNPTEYIHVGIRGDTDVIGVMTKDYIDTRLLDSMADTLAEMAADMKLSDVGVEGTHNPWTPRWF